MSPRPEAAGDPARLLALLWRHHQEPPRRRGPRPAFSVDGVVDAAIAVADQAGLDSLSMRAVAEALGASTMSLYSYVPGRAELIDLMVDTLYARMPAPSLTELPWDRRLRAVADANLALVEAHPWLAGVSSARPPLGPGVMAKYEYELSAFDDLGLDDVTIDDCLSVLLTFVAGVGRTAAAARVAEQTSGISDQQWWATNGPLLARVFDATAFPRATRIGTAAGSTNGSAYDPARVYQFGLSRILDGIAALIPIDHVGGPDDA